jgi:hypothetical protein
MNKKVGLLWLGLSYALSEKSLRKIHFLMSKSPSQS